MALPLRASTANQVLVIGPFLDDTDGKTPETGLTITNNNILVFKHNNASSAAKNNGGGNNAGGGWYSIVLDDTDTNTIGRLQLSCQMTGALPVWLDCYVHNAVWYDSLYGTDYAHVDLIQISGANVSNTAAQLGVNVIQIANNAPGSALIGNVTNVTNVANANAAVATIAANAVTAAAFNQAAADKVWATAARTLTANTNLNLLTSAQVALAVWDAARASYANAGSFGEGVASVQGNITGTLTALAANSITATVFNQAAADKVWSTAARTLTGSANIFSDNAITAASFNQGAADKVWASASRTLTALGANTVDATSFAQNAADKVWSTAARTLTGAANLTTNNNAITLHTDDKVIIAGTTHTSAVIPAVSAVNNVTGSVASVTALAANSITAAAIDDGAIDAATFAAGAINAAAIADGAIDAATFAADVDAEVAGYVWNAETASYGGAGTYGQAAEDTLADTNELQADWANDGRLDVIVDAILADTNELQTDDTPGALAALETHGDGTWATATGFSTHSAADVWDSTSATLSLSFETLMDRLYRFMMNKMNITDATGAVALRNEADSGDIATQSITDDDTTTTRTALSWS